MSFMSIFNHFAKSAGHNNASNTQNKICRLLPAVNFAKTIPHGLVILVCRKKCYLQYRLL